MINKIIQKYLNWIQKKGSLSICVSLLLMLGLTAGLSQFYSKNDVRIWFEKTDPKLDTLNYLEQTFGNDETLVIVAHLPESQSGDLFESKRLEVINEITQEAWKIPQVLRVESPHQLQLCNIGRK